MKLIHCADLHLDAPMESRLPPERARERRGELRLNFARLIEEAKREGVRGILIAGDLFDASHITKSTEKYVVDLIASHPDIAFFYLAGNHDKGSALRALEGRPENLYLFENDWTSHSLEGVVIAGSEYPNFDALTLDAKACNIVMLHGQLQSGKGRLGSDILPLGKLKGKGIDYLALGHLHSYAAAALDARGIAVYCGCLEGRGFDECGKKGYVLLELENGRITHRFVPFAGRTWHAVECSVEGLSSGTDLETRALNTTRGIPSGDMVKLILSGKCPPDAHKDVRQLSALLASRFYFAKVKDESRMALSPEDYQNDISLKGEFIRRVMASNLSEEEKERTVACGLSALGGEEILL